MPATHPHDRAFGPAGAPFRPTGVRLAAAALPVLALILASLETGFVVAAGAIARMFGGG
jgi:hypothetical protein